MSETNIRFQVTRTKPSVDGEGTVQMVTEAIDVPGDMTISELVGRTLYSRDPFDFDGKKPQNAHTRHVLTLRAMVDPGDPALNYT